MNDLIALLKANFRIAVLDGDTPLISSGLVDSLRLADLLLLLEKHYGRAIDPRDVGTDNFDTPAQILEFFKGNEAPERMAWRATFLPGVSPCTERDSLSLCHWS